MVSGPFNDDHLGASLVIQLFFSTLSSQDPLPLLVYLLFCRITTTDIHPIVLAVHQHYRNAILHSLAVPAHSTITSTSTSRRAGAVNQRLPTHSLDPSNQRTPRKRTRRQDIR